MFIDWPERFTPIPRECTDWYAAVVTGSFAGDVKMS
jgi:hypothetical protein